MRGQKDRALENFLKRLKKIGLTFQRIDNNQGANSERTKGWALENLKVLKKSA